MSAVVFIDRLEPAESKRDALIGLLREFAESIVKSRLYWWEGETGT